MGNIFFFIVFKDLFLFYICDCVFVFVWIYFIEIRSSSRLVGIGVMGGCGMFDMGIRN